jgi:hypothetical protein
LVTAGHHFLLSLIPFRRPDSLVAIEQFLAHVRNSTLSWPDIDAVLIRCLSVIDTHAERRIPTLVERYCSAASSPNRSLAAFEAAVGDVIRYASVTDGSVQQEIALI